ERRARSADEVLLERGEAGRPGRRRGVVRRELAAQLAREDREAGARLRERDAGLQTPDGSLEEVPAARRLVGKRRSGPARRRPDVHVGLEDLAGVAEAG